MTRPRRFPPPIAGGAQKTGWEALEKWVGGSGSSGEGTSGGGGEAPSGKKTGWEALDKWVGDGGAAEAPSAEASAANGAAAEEPVAAQAAGGQPSQGGFMGWLKRVFGGK